MSTFNLCKIETGRNGVKVRILGTPFRKERVVTLDTIIGAHVGRKCRIRAAGMVDAFCPVESPAWSWEFWGKLNSSYFSLHGTSRRFQDPDIRRERARQKVWEIRFEFSCKERERPFMVREGEGEYCSILCFSKKELKRVVETLKAHLEPGWGTISCWSSHQARYLGLDEDNVAD